jgi:hypothetical protein
VDWPQPWIPAGKAADAAALVRELQKEIAPGHSLFGKTVSAVAWRRDCDDVLYEVAGEPKEFAVVHLTWKGSREADPRLPWTRLSQPGGVEEPGAKLNGATPPPLICLAGPLSDSRRLSPPRD